MAQTKVTKDEMNFSQDPNSDGYIIVGNIMIQWGQTSAVSTGTYKTFPVAFGGAPRVMTNLNDPGSQDARAYNISSTGCTLRHNYASSALAVQWLAIGPA